MSSIIEEIAAGVHDSVLDEVADAVTARKNHLDPSYYMDDLSSINRDIKSAYMQSTEKRARIGIESTRNLRRIKEEAAHLPMVVSYADLLQEKVLIECLNFSREQAKAAVEGRTIDKPTNGSTLVIIDNSGSVTEDVRAVMHTEVRRFASEGAVLVVVDGQTVTPVSAETWRDVGGGGFDIHAAKAWVEQHDPNPYSRIVVLTDDDTGHFSNFWPREYQRIVIPRDSVPVTV